MQGRVAALKRGLKLVCGGDQELEVVVGEPTLPDRGSLTA
jgi:hypothetical protein